MPNTNQNLPKADQKVLSKSKDERLKDRIRETNDNVLYYKKGSKWALPLGIVGVAYVALQIILDISFFNILNILAIICFLNGIYWFFKARAEQKKLDKLLDVRERRNARKASSSSPAGQDE